MHFGRQADFFGIWDAKCIRKQRFGAIKLGFGSVNFKKNRLRRLSSNKHLFYHCFLKIFFEIRLQVVHHVCPQQKYFLKNYKLKEAVLKRPKMGFSAPKAPIFFGIRKLITIPPLLMTTSQQGGELLLKIIVMWLRSGRI